MSADSIEQTKREIISKLINSRQPLTLEELAGNKSQDAYHHAIHLLIKDDRITTSNNGTYDML